MCSKTIKALRFAKEKHFGQFRKGSNLPYIVHPIDVAKKVRRYKTSKNIEELVCAAYLHDVVEDCNVTLDEIRIQFGDMVCQLVGELTSCNIQIKKMGKKEYLKQKMVGMTSYGLTIKLADRLSNVSDRPTDKCKNDTIEIMNHLMNERRLTNNQNVMVTKILGFCYV
jgi:(p)ppGpp synthase/HD superfamily hydrolase